MIPTLVAVTLISLTFALAMLVVVWRVLRDERRRSAARVEMLEAASRDQHSATPLAWDRPVPRPAPIPSDAVRQSPAVALLNLAAGPEPEVDAEMPAGSHDLFASSAAPARVGRRFGMVAAVGLLVVGTAGTIIVSWNLHAQPGPKQAVAQAETVSSRSPIELVSLSHRREGDQLTVTGLVRNPVNGAPIKSLTAMVSFYARDGAFITSARAAIDYSTLLPGDESPFVVTVQRPANVGRYRVSFRTDDRVVPHVDHREDTRLARSSH
jgi:hypothetical protein